MKAGALLREPLLHFLVLGALLFGLFGLLDDTPPPAPAERIVVTEAEAERLAGRFEATWRRPPDAAERARLLERYVEEEVLVREARTLGLDRGDAVVRQRLAQKMGFLIESGAEAAEPTDAVLRSHMESHPDRFRVPARVAFEQVPLGDDGAGPVLAALDAGASPGAVGGRSLLPAFVPPSPRQAVDGTFGEGFFDAVAALPPGEWAGPVASGYGGHVVRLGEHRPARLPPLEEVRGEVERDWRAETRVRLAGERLDALLDRYEIVLPDVAGTNEAGPDEAEDAAAETGAVGGAEAAER
jgi:hypothetical protein